MHGQGQEDQIEDVDDSHRDGIGGVAGRVHSPRRVGQRRQQDGIEGRIVVVPEVIIHYLVEIMARTDSPCGSQITAEIAHAPAQESGAILHQNTERDDQCQEQKQSDPVPARKTIQRAYRAHDPCSPYPLS